METAGDRLGIGPSRNEARNGPAPNPIYEKFVLHTGTTLFNLVESRPINKNSLVSIMKALMKKERHPGLWLEEVPVPEVGINDVLIRVDRAGICGTAPA